MKRIFGFDIGVTSIGFCVADIVADKDHGAIVHMGVRIFPEARDPEGAPLNQLKRAKRMARRQLRRRRDRRRQLAEALASFGLLPLYNTPEWAAVMASDPYALRKRALSEAAAPWELGRLLYHLAKRRHFKGRDLDDEADKAEEDGADEKAAKTNREATLRALKDGAATLGAWLADIPADQRKRGRHAVRSVVNDEFHKIVSAQAAHHPILRQDGVAATLEDAIFAQRPVFWRKNTLGSCRFIPGAELCPKGSWLSQQRRMLEKLNNLALAGGNGRPLEAEERAAILAALQSQASMSWGGVRKALEPLFKAQGASAKHLKFNLELGGEDKLPGNVTEMKLAQVFGPAWAEHPHKQAIRDSVPERLWRADYSEIGHPRTGVQRVVIKGEAQRRVARQAAADSFIADFAVTPEQAQALAALTFPAGWEPFSNAALQRFLPRLAAGARMGTLLNSPDEEKWRADTFPDREQPTGEVHDRLPSPKPGPQGQAERERIKKLRNPTVVRVRNELRKVVNNLIAVYGKPDLIRIELARDIGLSKREREEMLEGMRQREKQRKAAIKDLQAKGIAEPSPQDIEKWLLWKEARESCPYTGDKIGFADLFADNKYEVEHIWPRSLCFDDGFRNKTLCRKDVNIAKSNQTPFEYFQTRPAKEWEDVKQRLEKLTKKKADRDGLSPGKVKRFLREAPLDGDFTARQLTDTGYAARQAVEFLKLLWPDEGIAAPVRVQTVSGRVTAHCRKYWGLNHILADDGEKTRDDHRHHAVDALVVACVDPGITGRLSRFFQQKDDPAAQRPQLSPPWPSIRADAQKAVEAIIVSHRVRKKVSGPLHKETIYGDAKIVEKTKKEEYRLYVTRKKVEALSKGEVFDAAIRDPEVRRIVKAWVEAHGGDPKKAFADGYPRMSANGPEIRKVRLLVKRQPKLMAAVSTGFAQLDENHHIALYRLPGGKVDFEAVSLLEAARRLAQRQPVVCRDRPGAEFVMSLSKGDVVFFPDGARKGLWIMQGVWASGQVVLWRAEDARGATVFYPQAASILRDGGRKVQVDPIGRIRPAND
ncbi:MAG TPA: type II CRISPR RNA-guided endonuclease Cas9 [Azospirillaceae bacterium]|nr:type II CRISPR RNA-guided endonuclease Cas9 [Azospirillaceae bacterium]